MIIRLCSTKKIISIIAHRPILFIISIYKINTQNTRRTTEGIGLESKTSDVIFVAFIDSDKNKIEIKFQTSVQILIFLRCDHDTPSRSRA